METAALTLTAAGDWIFPVSGVLFCLYPVAILMWTVIEGRLAAATSRQAPSPGDETPPSPKALEESVFREAAKSNTNGIAAEKTGRSRGAALPLAIAAAALLALVGAGVSFVSAAGGGAAGARHGAGQLDSAGRAAANSAAMGSAGGAPASVGAAAGGSVAMGVALVAGLAIAGLASSARARSACRAAVTGATSGTTQVPRYSPPPANGVSLWHDVDLHVKSWLDEDTGLYRYVNEMPLGCLQKFEVQPHLPDNAVEEDPKGSNRLAAFGRPVPFNYGCFPQTFRDPNCKDELYGAPGDNDPLDVLDLARNVAGVGQVVRCRPLGAVCLIDEGEADWKILAVNVDADEPLAEARSIEDVHRLAPGRIDECLQWIDDFKHSNGKDEAHLDFQVHEMSRAVRLIEEDHKCWQQLLQEVGPDNMARGEHWVRSPRRFAVTQPLPQMQPPMPKLGWPPSIPKPQLVAPAPWPLVGASAAMAASSRTSTPVLRRQDCHASSPTSQASSPTNSP